MSAHIVSFQIDAANANNESSTEEMSARRQIQSENGPIPVTGVAEAFGSALAVLRARMLDASPDDIVYAFRKGLTGERA
jgi:hypothetical protein